MKNFIKIIIVVITMTCMAFFVACSKEKDKEMQVDKPYVALSTFSLYDITKFISADTMNVFMILPAGVDAHSFEPTPRLMIDIQKSDLVVYSGAGLEPWIDNFDFKSKVIDMSKHVKLRELNADTKHEHTSRCTHGTLDPHYWLDIQNMIIATNVITNELIKILPSNTALYMKNREKYIMILESLDAEYRKVLSRCKKETIIVNHNAFSYISDKYGFQVEALSGLSPDAQPSAKSMLKLIKHVREDNISTIFFESFVSDKAIKSIANEAHVGVDVLHPLGNITAKQMEKNLSFEDIMKINLKKISKALECQ